MAEVEEAVRQWWQRLGVVARINLIAYSWDPVLQVAAMSIGHMDWDTLPAGVRQFLIGCYREVN